MRVRTNCDYVSESECTDCWPKVLFLTVKNPCLAYSLVYGTLLLVTFISCNTNVFGGLSYFICY